MNARRRRERRDIVTAMIERLRQMQPSFSEDLAHQLEMQIRQEEGGREHYVYGPPKITDQKRDQAHALMDMGVPRATAYRKAG